jgi:hypothetical protein
MDPTPGPTALEAITSAAMQYDRSAIDLDWPGIDCADV